MTLTLLRADARRPLRPPPRQTITARRRQRAMNKLARAIQYGLSMPDSEAARQARLLADIFGPQLGMDLDEPLQEPQTIRILHKVEGNAARP
jgi:hypothetical protein